MIPHAAGYLTSSRRLALICALVTALAAAVGTAVFLLGQEADARARFLDYIADAVESSFGGVEPKRLQAATDVLTLRLGRLSAGRASVRVTGVIDPGAGTTATAWTLHPASDGVRRVFAASLADSSRARVTIDLLWSNGFSIIGLSTFLTGVSGVFFTVLFALLAAFSLYHRRIVHALVNAVDELRPMLALARGAQMLAHDIRKPFTMVKMILQSLQANTDPSQVRAVVDRSLPEIDAVTERVDGMIGDIMEFGAVVTALEVEPVSVESLIEASLSESFKVHRTSDVQLEYRLQHSRKVSVNGQKVLRVFSNIICNAVQAMHGRGRIWFQTREVGRGAAQMLELCIGNSGSAIPADDLPHLFEPFFTSGKKGGTGLGLAIAEKVITDHGGTIRATSEPDVGVEFWLTLPLAAELNRTTAVLPLNSGAIVEALAMLSPRGTAEPGSADVDTVVKALGKRERFRILIVDDEAIYRRSLEALLAPPSPLSPFVEVRSAADGAAALLAVGDGEPDLIICDVDLGEGALDGIALTQTLRASGCRSDLCIHSNRCLPSDYKTAIEAGATAVLPKPMSREHLLRLVLARLNKAPPTVSGPTGGRPEIALIEDDVFIREVWEQGITDAKLHVYATPEAFRAALAADRTLAGRLKLVVTDFNFGGVSNEDGHDVAQFVHGELGLPVLVASELFSSLPRRPEVSAYIDKLPLSYAELAIHARAKGRVA